MANKLPVLGIPTHDIEIEPYRSKITINSPIYSLIPAGRGELSWMRHGIGKSDGLNETSIGISSPTKLVERFEPGALLCGEACDLMNELVEPSRFAGVTTTSAGSTRDPNSILDIASAFFESGKSSPYDQLRPIYARPPSISQPKTPK